MVESEKEREREGMCVCVWCGVKDSRTEGAGRQAVSRLYR